MNIIRRRVIKEYLYTRKKPSKATTLESLGFSSSIPKDMSKTEFISSIIDKWISKIDIVDLSRISRYSNHLSNKVVLSKEQLITHITTLVYDALSNYLTNGSMGIYNGEYFAVQLTTNHQGKHIILLYPSIEI